MRRISIVLFATAMATAVSSLGAFAEGPRYAGSIKKLAAVEKAAFTSLSKDRLKTISRAPVTGQTGNPGFTLSMRALDAQPRASGGEQWSCLTEALYFEARGESLRGQVAVAEVILNRVASKRFPNSICGVVNQGTGKKFQCQFTYTCDGHPERINEKDAFVRAGKIARMMMEGAPRNLSGGATYYHTTAVRPKWSRQFRRTARHGVHLFYSPA